MTSLAPLLTQVPLPLIVLLSAVAILLPLVGRYTKDRGGMDPSPKITLVALSLGIAYISFVALRGIGTPISSPVLSWDLFTLFFTFLFLIVSIIITLASFTIEGKSINSEAFYSLLLFTTVGMILVALSQDLLMLFIAWSLVSVSTYALAGIRKDALSAEGAMKYFVISALSSAIILYAISLIYGVTGTTNIPEIMSKIALLSPDARPLLAIASILLLAGFGFKMGIVPFHMWLPDTYEGIPPSVSALLAGGTKSMGFVAFIKVTVLLGPLLVVQMNIQWGMTLAVLALVTMTLGNIAALTQKSLTRLLAYSSIAHAGYILIGLAVIGQASSSVDQLGLGSSLFHILNHAVLTAGAFIAAMVILSKVGGLSLDSLKGLGKRMPITAFSLSIILLALAGIPPLSAFWSKAFLFSAALQADLAWLALAGVLNSAFSLAYYAIVIKKMYMEKSTVTTRIKEPRSVVAALLIVVLLTIGIGLAFGPALSASIEAALPILSP